MAHVRTIAADERRAAIPLHGEFDVANALLTAIGADLADAANVQAAAHGPAPVYLTIRDVVPLSAADPSGLVFSAVLLPLTICSVIIAAAIGVLVVFRPAWRQLVALTAVSAVAGAGAYLISQTFLGALPGQGAADWASLASRSLP